MKYQQQFFTAEQLALLKSRVLAAINLKTDNINQLTLTGIDSLTDKISRYISQVHGQAVEYHGAYIFLASDSTMKYGKKVGAQPNWHTDATCTVVDGDCYNAWVPLFNDSTESGIAVIPSQTNPELYQKLTDPTYQVTFYHKDRDPSIFAMLPPQAKQTSDLLVVTPNNGMILPIDTRQLNIEYIKAAKPGDLALFKQSEIHGGFHNGGIRIQMSLKFRLKSAKLNQQASNSLYPLFKNLYHNLLGQPEFPTSTAEFNAFNQLYFLMQKQDKVSKHATLKYETITSLLRC